MNFNYSPLYNLFIEGIFNSPNSASAMVSVPRTKRGAASGWRMMMLFLAQVI